MSDPRDVIAALRDGGELTPSMIEGFVQGLAKGAVTDAQAAAFAMAVILRPLKPEQRSLLTCAMRDSGQVLAWPAGGAVIDKHSTGGVGDATSFVIAPILASCGLRVPMISGRALGHTGGTLDKLESIAGLCVDASPSQLQAQVNDIGLGIFAATQDIAPADRRLYAIRDEAACVPSVDLITSSILSKKLAEGLDGLVLDVKFGAASFVQDRAKARELAEAMVATAKAAGVRCVAILSDMSQPLAGAIGNAVEVYAALQVLMREGRQERLAQLSLSLAAHGLVLGGVALDVEQGLVLAQEAISSKRALRAVEAMVAAQSGRDSVDIEAEFEDLCPLADYVDRVVSQGAGYVQSVDPIALAQIVADLGGARRVAGERIDHAIGITDLCAVGDHIDEGGLLGRVHAQQEVGPDIHERLRSAVTLVPDPVAQPPLILDVVM